MSDSPQPAMPTLPAVFQVSAACSHANDILFVQHMSQDFLTHDQAKFALLAVVAPSFLDRLQCCEFRGANIFWNKASYSWRIFLKLQLALRLENVAPKY
jgi:hypothetical protein